MSAIISIKVKPHVLFGEICRLIIAGVEFVKHGEHYYFEFNNVKLIKRMQKVNTL